MPLSLAHSAGPAPHAPTSHWSPGADTAVRSSSDSIMMEISKKERARLPAPPGVRPDSVAAKVVRIAVETWKPTAVTSVRIAGVPAEVHLRHEIAERLNVAARIDLDERATGADRKPCPVRGVVLAREGAQRIAVERSVRILEARAFTGDLTRNRRADGGKGQRERESSRAAARKCLEVHHVNSPSLSAS